MNYKGKKFEPSWSVLPYPPYSPNLASNNYCLFRLLHIALMRTIFCNETEIQDFVKLLLGSSFTDKWQQLNLSNGEYIIE